MRSNSCCLPNRLKRVSVWSDVLYAVNDAVCVEIDRRARVRHQRSHESRSCRRYASTSSAVLKSRWPGISSRTSMACGFSVAWDAPCDSMVTVTRSPGLSSGALISIRPSGPTTASRWIRVIPQLPHSTQFPRVRLFDERARQYEDGDEGAEHLQRLAPEAHGPRLARDQLHAAQPTRHLRHIRRQERQLDLGVAGEARRARGSR